MSAELEALALRVEAAGGADRLLDVLIGCAVRFAPDSPGCEWAKAEHWQYVPVPRISERIGCADKAGNVAAHWEAPRYTASLDTAMTLYLEVPERIPSDPRIATAEALRQRAAAA